MNHQARTPANGVNPLKTAANIESASRSAAEPQAAEKVNALGDLPSWDLSDLYASPEDEQIFADLDEAESSAKRFIDAYAGKLTGLAAGDADALAESVRIYEALGDALGKIGSYARLLYEADGSSPVHAKFLGDIQERLNTIGSGLLFYELELNQISDDELASALKSAALAHYEPWLRDIRKERPHQLPEDVERLFHEKSVTGYSAWNRLFDETIASLRFDVDGEEMTIAPVLNLMSSPDAATRKSAALSLTGVLGENLRIFTHISNTLAKDKEISDRWRHFGDIADSRHLANRVEKEVVDALEAAVVEAYPKLSHRYYALKAKWLGMDRLEHWDRNAPLPEADERLIPWDEAKDTVLGAYAGFAPEMAEIAGKFFDRKWIDAPVRPGKSPGAFSASTVPSVHPYVLLNYQGKTRDVMTLAHELGHGVHQVLAAKQGALMAPTPLTLAETASVFGEMLTFRALLAGAKDKSARKAMLAAKTEDMLNTVVRQIAFYRFERKLHGARRKGELTSDQISAMWMEVQAESLGPAIHLGAGYETLWAFIPHFIHSPFYVYAYAFGDCLVNSLYAAYTEAPEGFAGRYFELLGAGGSKHHSELLAPFGLDAREPVFWSRGLEMISGFIDELEGLD